MVTLGHREEGHYRAQGSRDGDSHRIREWGWSLTESGDGLLNDVRTDKTGFLERDCMLFAF
jgi:hypothetical protein